MPQVNYKEFIEVNPEVRFSKPVIKGTRITVYDILQWLASGLTYKEITDDFPQLNEDHILACLAYAANKERIIKVA
ncbi:DUF433 domain-containing protein [Mucilaginibacter sp. SJ]|uniref:DUF433 domain-containing protein n=1 Tax=Mucilaginibacter sp. SJ TaxID=3029053 RepID=UPI0023A97E71|nr:DUF433 domain-containing protein [Mucilaginibacter sp. SJ]WDZ99852.1 DUF433 domain-containing protein [Mucilaginibacter sp. SJ]